jgi:hypothetical protein
VQEEGRQVLQAPQAHDQACPAGPHSLLLSVPCLGRKHHDFNLARRMTPPVQSLC